MIDATKNTKKGGRPKKQIEVVEAKLNFTEALIYDLDRIISENDYYTCETVDVFGESRTVSKKLTTKFRNACLWLLNRIGKNPSITSDEMRDYYSEYWIMRSFLFDNGFLYYNNTNLEKEVLMYFIAKTYIGSHLKVLTESEQNAYAHIDEKKYTRAKKIVTTEGIQIKLTDAEIRKLMETNKNSKGENYTEKAIIKNQEIVRNINTNGTLREDIKANRRGRFYYDINSLADCVSKHITFNGKKSTMLDQHATYLWLLPEMIKKTASKEQLHSALQLELKKYMEMLNEISRSKGNLYQHFSDIFDCGLSKDDVKKNILSWYCEPNCNDINGGKRLKIEEGFTKEFPEIRKYLKLLSSGKNLVSIRTMAIEGSFFISLAKDLKKKGLNVLTKHDCIIVNEDQSEFALQYAQEKFNHKFGYSSLINNKNVSVPSTNVLPNEVSDSNRLTVKEKGGEEEGGYHRSRFESETPLDRKGEHIGLDEDDLAFLMMIENNQVKRTYSWIGE